MRRIKQKEKEIEQEKKRLAQEEEQKRLLELGEEADDKSFLASALNAPLLKSLCLFNVRFDFLGDHSLSLSATLLTRNSGATAAQEQEPES